MPINVTREEVEKILEKAKKLVAEGKVKGVSFKEVFGEDL